MTMSPRLAKLTLTAHVTSSVGWLGAVATSLALAIVGVTSQDAQVVRAVYLAMERVGWLVLVPLSFASLATGLVQSLGTKWGLFRHYWVIVKLMINIIANVVLLMYMQTLAYFADRAASESAIAALQDPSPVVHSGGAIVLLLMATVLSIYKPRGLTRYGQRKLRTNRTARDNVSGGAVRAAPTAT